MIGTHFLRLAQSSLFCLLATIVLFPLAAMSQGSGGPCDDSGSPTMLGAGDIAFTAFNSDGKDIGFVLLTDVEAGTSFRISDNDWNGSSIWENNYLTWTTGCAVAAGTVVTIESSQNTGESGGGSSINVGSVTQTGAFQMNGGDEEIWAYQGTAPNLVMLAAISNDNGKLDLSNSGLHAGHVVYTSDDEDGFEYAGQRTCVEASQINDIANWSNYGNNGANVVLDATSMTVPGEMDLLFCESFENTDAFSGENQFFISHSNTDYFGIWDPAGASDDFGAHQPAGMYPVGLPTTFVYKQADGNILMVRDLDGGGTNPSELIWTMSTLGYESCAKIELLMANDDMANNRSVAVSFSTDGVNYAAGTGFDFTGISFWGNDALEFNVPHVAPVLLPIAETVYIKLTIDAPGANEYLGIAEFKIRGMQACEDANANNICDEDEVLGCTDSEAENYDAAANVDDGSCVAVVCEVVAEATTGANTLCSTPLPPPEDNCDCNGKMQNLTLEFVGPSGSTVTVYDGDGSSATLIATYSNVSNGDVLFVSAENLSGGDFEAWTSFYTCGSAAGDDDTECDHAEIHTSCSQDILGMTFGDFYVLGYTDGQGDQCGTLGSEGQTGCNGTINLTASNGESPFDFLWSDGSTDEDRDGLCAGTYSVTVTDANGCSTSLDVVVEDEPGTVTVSVDVVPNTACTGNTNNCTCSDYLYEFTVVYNGPSGVVGGAYDYHDNTYGEWTLQTGESYTFNVSNSNHPGEDNPHNDPMMWTHEGDWVHHGTYDATCGGSTIGQAFGPFTLVGFVDVHGNACGGSSACNGSADVTVSQGVPPFAYLWSDGSSAGDRSNLCAGTHQLTVTDAGGCSSTVDVVVEDNPGTVGVEVTTEANTVCSPPLPPAENNCDCEGKMQNFTVEYNGPAGATVTAYDDDDGSAILIVTYTNVSPGEILFISGENLSGADLETRTYLYVDGGNEADIHTSCSQNILDMTFGDFTVLGFTDGQGDQCGILGDGNYGGCNGVAQVTVTEGEAPFAYLWSDGSTVGDRSNLCSGTYQLTVTDAGGCSSTVDVVVEDNPATVTVEVETEANSVCDAEPAECTCEAYLYAFTVVYNGPSNITGGAYDYHDNTYGEWSLQTGDSYTFNVSNSNHPGEDHAHNDPMMWTHEGEWIHHGTYDATCGQSYIGQTFGPFTLTGFVDAHGNECTGSPACNGSAVVTASSGEAPYTYLWSDGGTTATRSELCPGTYEVEVTDANGCLGTQTVTIGQGSELDLTVSASDETCPGTCDGSAHVSVVGGTGSHTVLWSNGATTADVTGLCAGEYNVTVTDGDCESTETVIISSGDAPEVTVTSLDPNCDNNNGSITFTFVDNADRSHIEFSIDGGVTWPEGYKTQDDVGAFTIENLTGQTYGLLVRWGNDECEVDLPDVTLEPGCFSTPQVLTGVNPEVTLQCGETIPSDAPAFEDACGGALIVAHTSLENDLDCANSYEIVRTWTATNGCEQSATVTQTITVVDTVGPAITCPSDALTLECGDSVHPDNTGHATVTDLCSDVVLTYHDGEDSDASNCVETFVRTWTATDACENTSTCEQTITLTDTEQPYWTSDLPANATLACGAEAPTPSAVTASDACQGDLTVEVSEAYAAEGCGLTGVYTFTWTADDGCTEPISYTQTITVVNAPPTSTCPGNVSLECGDSIHPDQTGYATGEDDCGEVTVTYVDVVEETAPECASTATITRTWTITDECELSVSCIQIIDFVDNEPPQITETCDISNGEVIELCCTGPNASVEVPEACTIAYTDNCGATLTYTETTTGDVPGDTYLTCAVNTPEAFEDGETCTNLETHSLRLFGFPGATGPATFFSIVEGTGEVEYTDAENWTVTMRVVSNERDDAGFDVSVTYGEGLGWEDWSSRSVPSSYKRDCPDLPDLHEEWMYFIVQSGSLSGWGAYEGSSFSLTHQPANEYYGCQVGVAANNMNANYGFSGWLMYIGTLVEDGVETEVLSSGDLFGELDCCLPFTVSRTYLVEDCAGNATTFTYHVVSAGEECDQDEVDVAGQDHTPIVVSGNGNLLGDKTPISISNLVPNPAANSAEVRFTVNEPMRVQADLTDMSGNLIDQLFEGVVQPGITYTVDLEVETMASGMYQVRLASNSYLVVRKLLVTD